MDENCFVLLTDDIDISADVDSNKVIRIRGGMKPSGNDVKWYTAPSTLPEYYSKWQEYDRLDLHDGKSSNDEVLSDGKYHPENRYVVYSSIKDTTIKIRPVDCKDLLATVKTAISPELPDHIARQAFAKLVAQRKDNPKIQHVICEIDDISDIIALEDIFAVIDSVDSIEHDILKNEIKLYIFEAHRVYHPTLDDKIKAYNDIKKRVEAGFYKKKLEYLDILRYTPDMEPQNRDAYLRCGVLPQEGETSEHVYDRVKSYVEQLYRDFERYKDSFEEMDKNIFSKLPRAIATERDDWDQRYNDEAITEAMVAGYMRFFSGLYISNDAEVSIIENADKRRRFRYNRTFQVTTLAVFDSDCIQLEKLIDVEEIRQKNVEKKQKQQEMER